MSRVIDVGLCFLFLDVDLEDLMHDFCGVQCSFSILFLGIKQEET
jgi:hypothetical protein